MKALSKSQKSVCQLAANGLDNKTISRKVEISEATVKVHLKAAFTRLGISNRTQLLQFFIPEELSLPEYEPDSKEKMILEHLSTGSTDKEISHSVGIPEPSIKATIRTLRRKLGFRCRTELAAWYLNKIGKVQITASADFCWNEDRLKKLSDLLKQDVSLNSIMTEFSVRESMLREGIRQLLS